MLRVQLPYVARLDRRTCSPNTSTSSPERQVRKPALPSSAQPSKTLDSTSQRTHPIFNTSAPSPPSLIPELASKAKAPQVEAPGLGIPSRHSRWRPHTRRASLFAARIRRHRALPQRHPPCSSHCLHHGRPHRRQASCLRPHPILRSSLHSKFAYSLAHRSSLKPEADRPMADSS